MIFDDPGKGGSGWAGNQSPIERRCLIAAGPYEDQQALAEVANRLLAPPAQLPL